MLQAQESGDNDDVEGTTEAMLVHLPSCVQCKLRKHAERVFQTALKFTPLEFAVVDVVGHLAHGAGAALYKHKLRSLRIQDCI